MRYAVDIVATVYIEAESWLEARERAEAQENWNDNKACVIESLAAYLTPEEDVED